MHRRPGGHRIHNTARQPQAHIHAHMTTHAHTHQYTHMPTQARAHMTKHALACLTRNVPVQGKLASAEDGHGKW